MMTPSAIIEFQNMKIYFPWKVLVSHLTKTFMAICILFSTPTAADAFDIEEFIKSLAPDIFQQIREKALDVNHDNTQAGKRLDLPIFEFSLSRKDIATFLELHRRLEKVTDGNDPDAYTGREYYQLHNKWREASLRYRGKTYRIKAKSHGRNPNGHRKGKFISLTIKVLDGQQIHQTRRFNLIIRERIPFWSTSYRDFAGRFGLLQQQIQLVRVKINDWEEKLYYFERRLNDHEMEATGNSSLRRFGATGNQEGDKSMIFTSGPIETTFSETEFRKTFNLVLDKTDELTAHKEAYLERYTAFNKAISSGDGEAIRNYVDLDYISSFVAGISLGGLVRHGFMESNLYVFYNRSNGKFYPALTRDVQQAVYRPNPNETFEQLFNRARPDSHNPMYPANLPRVPLLVTLSKNDVIRQEKYRKIHQFLTMEREKAVRGQFSKWQESESLHLLGLVKLFFHKVGLIKYKDMTGSQFEVLHKYLRRANPKIKVGYSGQTFTLEIEPRAMSELSIGRLILPPAKSFAPTVMHIQIASQKKDDKPVLLYSEEHKLQAGEIEKDLSPFLAHLRLSTSLGSNSEAVDRRYLIHFRFNQLVPKEITSANLDIGMTNAITGEPVSADKLAIARIPMTDTTRWSSILNKAISISPLALWRLRHPQYPVSREKGGRIRLHSGDYMVQEDLVFPPDLKVVLDVGTTLRIGAGKLVLAQNGIEIRGTKKRPVIVTSIDPLQHFGSLAVLGKKGTQSDINHLYVSNGSDRWHAGIFFSGGLSIYHNDKTRIRNSVFANNRADDGVNIKHGLVSIEDSKFIDNAADHIDLDYCSGSIVNSQFFMSSPGDSNGDGVDISGSEMVVKNSTFSGLGDKGISIGEKSRIYLTGNVLKSNNMGIAVKDLSLAYLFRNKFEGNVSDISIYQKKKIFGGGKAFIFEQFPGEAKSFKYKLDEKSEIVPVRELGVLNSISPDNQLRKVKQFLFRMQKSLHAENHFETVENTLLPVTTVVHETGSFLLGR
jgi:hypothetical protein